MIGVAELIGTPFEPWHPAHTCTRDSMSSALAGIVVAPARTSAPNTDATKLLFMIVPPSLSFSARATDRLAHRQEKRGGSPVCIVTASPGLSASREAVRKAGFAPAHDDVVIPGEHRAQHRREQPLPRLGDVDD